MPLLPPLVSLWRNLFNRNRVEQELAQELHAYLELLTETKIKDGLEPEEARRAALIELGGVEQVKERVRGVRIGHYVETVWRDLCYGAAGLRRYPLLSTAVIATLTLSIGITTAVFTLINAFLVRPHVDKDPSSFVRVYSSYTIDPARPGHLGKTTLDDYLSFSDQSRSLQDVTARARFSTPVGQDDPAETRILLVSSHFFSLYNLERPRLGRLLLPEDCSTSNPVAVLSEGLWRNRFAADPEIVGKVVRINGEPATVVGVAPTFAGEVDGAAAWLPYTVRHYLKLDGYLDWLTIEARLSPGFSRPQVAQELALLANQQDHLSPGRKTSVVVTDGSEIQDPDNRPQAIVFVSVTLGVLTFVVLMACANVATLLLARADARQQEIAIRLALGAGRRRLIRMLLTETLLLASIASLASLYFAYRLPALLVRWTGDRPFEFTLDPDWRVFLYLAAITLVTGTLAGLAPVLQSLNVNLVDSLKGRRGVFGAAASGARLRGLLVGAQVALSLMFLVGAGLFVQAHHQMSTGDPGFETRHVLKTGMSGQLAAGRSWAEYHHTLTQRIVALPGVQSVAYGHPILDVPGEDGQRFEVQFSGQPVRRVAMNEVSPGFFATLGIPIVRGRPIQETDPPCEKDGCPVVVSQEFVRQFLPGEDPLGKTLRIVGGNLLEIVGVARGTSSQQIGSPDDPLIYLPWAPGSRPYTSLVRFEGDPSTLSRTITSNIRQLVPDSAVGSGTIQSSIDRRVGDFGRLVSLVAILGSIAVALAVIGIYGVVSFAVSRRTRELGIRIALGAKNNDIYGTVLRSTMRPIVVGLLAGLAGGSLLAQGIRSLPFLPTLNTRDPLAYAAAIVLLAAVALAALIGPARRATRVDPAMVLRNE